MWRDGAAGVRGVRRAAAALVAAAGLLAAVDAAATPPPTAGGPALTAAELRTTIVGNTMYREGRRFGIRWHWAGHYRADGTAVARAWWGFGAIAARGRWRIRDGLWCQFWEDVDWSRGGRNCYRVFPAGDDLRWRHVRGPHPKDWRFAVRPGNAFALPRPE